MTGRRVLPKSPAELSSCERAHNGKRDRHNVGPTLVVREDDLDEKDAEHGAKDRSNDSSQQAHQPS